MKLVNAKGIEIRLLCRLRPIECGIVVSFGLRKICLIRHEVQNGRDTDAILSLIGGEAYLGATQF